MDLLIDLTEECPKPASIVSPLIPITNPTVPPMQFLQNTVSENYNNPFDEAFQQAADFGDPFESVLSMALQNHGQVSNSKAETATGNLIQIDSPSVVSDEKTMPKAVRLKDQAKTISSVKPNRLHSDSDISTLLKTIKNNSTPVNRKSRSNSLDQLVRRNQLLKHSNANSSPHATSSPFATPDKPGRSCDETMDNLLDTSPHWIDSETDESDLDSMCIPFLKRCTSPSISVQANERNSLAIESFTEHVERHNAQPIMPVVMEENPDDIMSTIVAVNPQDGIKNRLKSINESHGEAQKMKNNPCLLETIKQAIDKCDNIEDAKAILANLDMESNKPSMDKEMLTSTSNSDKDSLSLASATPTIIRQGTFNMEDLKQNEQNASAQSSSGELSPKTHMENVCEQLRLMNVNVNHWVVPNGSLPNTTASNNTTTYIMVLNTPTSNSTYPQEPDADKDSPTCYLKTRKSRSHSLSLPQKPSVVTQAILAKTALRANLNENVSTPTRLVTPSVARRSSFSSSSMSTPYGAAASGVARRSIYGHKSPVKQHKSPTSKINSFAAQSTLKTTSAHPPIKLRFSEAGRPSNKVGPLRATVPVKCVAPLKRDTPCRPPSVTITEPREPAPKRPSAPIRHRPSTGIYGSTTPNMKRMSMASPDSAGAARRRTVSDANVPVSHLPRPNMTSGKRLSNLPAKSTNAAVNKENRKPYNEK